MMITFYKNLLFNDNDFLAKPSASHLQWSWQRCWWDDVTFIHLEDSLFLCLTGKSVDYSSVQIFKVWMFIRNHAIILLKKLESNSYRNVLNILSKECQANLHHQKTRNFQFQVSSLLCTQGWRLAGHLIETDKDQLKSSF